MPAEIPPENPPVPQMAPDKQAPCRQLSIMVMFIFVLLATYFFISLIINSDKPPALRLPFIQPAATPTPIKLPTPTPVFIAPDEKISMVIIGPDCVVTVTTTKQTLSFKIGNDSSNSTCYPGQISRPSSNTKLFLAYTEQSEGIKSVIGYYSLRNNSHLTLDNFGTNEIRDYTFLPNDHLVVLEGVRGAFDQQYLDIYDLPSITKSSSASTHRRITLPNHDEEYSDLYFGNGHLEVSADYNHIREKYTTTQLLPVSSCPCWYEIAKTCIASDVCPLGQPKNP